MSFTTQVKEEVLGLADADRSQLSAFIKMSGNLGLTSSGLTLSILTENAKIARHIYSLLEDLYGVQPDIRYHQKTNLKKIVSILFLSIKKLTLSFLICN